MATKRKRKQTAVHSQNWPAYNAAQTNEKRHFLTLLHELCKGVEDVKQATGRPGMLLGDRIFCATYKVYSTFCMRRFSPCIGEAQADGYIQSVRKSSSVFRYLQMESLTPILTRLIEVSSLPLEPFESDFAVDSTGLSTCGYSRWLDEREMVEHSKKDWIKVHLICGVKTNIVGSAIVSSGHANDHNFFGRLVARTAKNFDMAEVSADKAYLSGENMRHALVAGSIPYIAFKSNSRLGAQYKGTLWNRMLAMMLYRKHEYMERYNKRNNVETTFWMIKSKFGGRVRSKTWHAKVNEALCKVLCHNIYVLIHSMYELGIDPTFPAIPAPAQLSEPEEIGRSLADTEYEIVRTRISQRKRPVADQNQSRERRGSKNRAAENQIPLFE